VPLFDKRYVAVLGAVVEAGRAALREIDADQVPAKLKRVARYTGRRLPVPLASSLLAEIDSSEWLRGEVVSVYQAGGRTNEVADAFLRRGEAWWVVVADAVADSAESEGALALSRTQTELTSVHGRLEAARKRERAINRRLEELEADRSGRLEERSAPLRAAADRERRRGDESEERLTAATGELVAAREAIADLEVRQRLLYERFQRTRSERAELERRLSAGDRGAIPSDPIRIARWLDDTARVLAPYRAGVDEVAAVSIGDEVKPLKLPPGVRPDGLEAIHALRALRPPWVLVDGHNVLGAIDHRSIGDAGARRALVDSLGVLARALSPGSIVVVFDSALSGGRESVDADSGVTVRFSPATSAADDVLAEEAGELGPGTVVISNDREVRERAAHSGALALWSDALVAWLSEVRREGVTTV
jgi:predicted RNA-binding protein with PIN domain